MRLQVVVVDGFDVFVFLNAPGPREVLQTQLLALVDIQRTRLRDLQERQQLRRQCPPLRRIIAETRDRSRLVVVLEVYSGNQVR